MPALATSHDASSGRMFSFPADPYLSECLESIRDGRFPWQREYLPTHQVFYG